MDDDFLQVKASVEQATKDLDRARSLLNRMYDPSDDASANDLEAYYRSAVEALSLTFGVIEWLSDIQFESGVEEVIERARSLRDLADYRIGYYWSKRQQPTGAWF